MLQTVITERRAHVRQPLRTSAALVLPDGRLLLARTLDIDPVELRRLNALQVSSITNTGPLLRESVGLLECIDKVDAEMRRLGGERPFEPRPVQGASHLRRAWGFAVGYKNTGLGGGAPAAGGVHADGHAR